MGDTTRKDCRFYNEITNDCKVLKMLYCKYEEKPCKFWGKKQTENCTEKKKKAKTKEAKK